MTTSLEFAALMARASRGPRPMPLHLANAFGLWAGATPAAGALAAGALMIHPSLEDGFASLRAMVEKSGGWPAFVGAVAMESSTRTAQFLEGVNRYLTHPYNRPESEATIAAEVGTMQVLDYGGDGTPVLMIPSLINPHYVLDLMPGRSMAAYLKERGLRPFLVNWNEPGDEEVAFDTGTYVMARLMPALGAVAAVAGGPAPVIGYCMGGTLAMGLAARAGEMLSKLALLAAPWDFEVSRAHAGRRMAPALTAMVQGMPPRAPVSVDYLQVFFASLDPTLGDNKFRKFAAMDQDSDAARFFVALETWANSGAALARPVAEECLGTWYEGNAPGRGNWMVADRPVDPAEVTAPVFVAAPKADRLVPQESALAVAKRLPNVVTHDPGAGHVGMIVGSKAKAGLWAPLADWLKEG